MSKYCLDYNELIERAWCYKTGFNDIFATDKLNENDVKKILRKKLKRKSYIIWRKRVSKIKLNKSFTI